MAADRVGLVLAGGGARAAYEVGALAVLLPELEARGERPAVLVGTSAGAINAVFLASTAHLPAAEAVERCAERWRTIAFDRVVRRVVGPRTPETALRYAAEVLGLPGVDLHGLLDPAPLEATLSAWIDWGAVHENVADGTVDAVAVVATAASTGRAVVFVEGRERESMYASYEADWAPATLRVDHVRASAAIPALFPAIPLDDPEGWYFDGGTRLNAPVKPVLDLGVDRVALVGTHSIRAAGAQPGRRPGFADGVQQLLQATLVDPLVNDVRMLGKINLLVADGPSEALSEFKRRRGKAPYRRIPYAFVAPRERGTIGRIASRVFAERLGGPRGVRSPDLAVLSRLLGGPGEAHGELLSYLFFAPAFAEALMTLGREDAERWLDQVGGPWLLEPVDVLEG